MALIMVLGMMALLMLLGVAFTVTMRTERMTAAFYVHQIRGEHFGHTAVARAVADLQAVMGDSVYPDGMFRGSAGNGVACDNLLTDAVESYLPGFVWQPARDYVSDGNVEWISVPGGLGAYAYLVVNTSGMLDANQAGGAPRHYGVNVGEVDIALLPEVSNAHDYLNTRAVDIRYETMPQVWDVQGGGGLATNLWTMNIRPPVPLGRRDDDGKARTDQVNIAGTAADLIAMKEDILAAFNDAGIDNTTPMAALGGHTMARIAFYNLVDYVDGDNIPANLDGTVATVWSIPSVEAVPMFNECLFNYTVSKTPGGPPDSWNYQGNGLARFEWAFKFPNDKFDGPYTLHGRVDFENSLGDGFEPQSFTFAYPWNAYRQYPTHDVPMPPVVLPNLADFPNDVTITARVSTWAKNADGHMVDTNQPLEVVMTFDLNANNPDTQTVGLECIDPRLNYYPSPVWWRSTDAGDPDSPPSIGAANDAALKFTDTDPGSDGYGNFFVANRPLKTVGELGYLFHGMPWRTIRLYRHLAELHTLHRVLDHFTLTEDKWQPGAINPNTEVGEILVAALAGMPRSYDADSTALPLTVGEAGEIAAAWLDDAYNMGFIANLSDLGGLTNVFHGTFLNGLTEPEKESLIRNAAGLFHPRQNHFTIVVAVNTFGAGGLEIGLRRLVAEVWRDPYQDSDGRHRVYLRSFQWVD